MRDPFAVLPTCGGVLALVVFRADALEVPTQRGGLFSVPNLMPEQLSMEAAQVTGSFMHLEYLPCFDRPTQDGALLAWKGVMIVHGPLAHEP